MKVTLAAMGCENISLEYLSAVLKADGHKVSLAYDPALFDDKNYFYKPALARLFDQREKTVQAIVNQNPDILGISVFASNYQWALDIAGRVKKRIDVPVVFGGIHPSAAPDEVIGNDCVDMICLDEGEAPMVELLKSMESGSVATDIENIWLKNNGEVIKNPLRPLQDINELPMPDKELFENDLPIKYMYLTVTSRGCPFACSFCSNSFLKRFQKGRGRFFRERNVALVMEELLHYKDKYDYQWVDIKNNTFSATKKWTMEFLDLYASEIARPLRVMGHAKKIDDEIAGAMKRAGVWRVQMGVESLDRDIRREVLKRKESNEEIFNALNALDRHGVGYSIDYMVGLPGQKDEELEGAAVTFAGLKYAVRITPFWLQYLYGTDLMDIGKKIGEVSTDGEQAAKKGQDHHYIYQGSVTETEKVKTLRSFHVLFRLAPSIGPKWTGWLVEKKRYKAFSYLPMAPVITLVDFFASFFIKDLTSIAYIKTYFWHMIKMAREQFSGVSK